MTDNITSLNILEGVALREEYSLQIQVGNINIFVSSEAHNYSTFINGIPKEWLGNLLEEYMTKRVIATNKPVFVFAHWEQPKDQTPLRVDRSGIEYMEMGVDIFLFALWLVRDFHTRLGIIVCKLDRDDLVYPTIVPRDIVIYDCCGKTNTTYFTPEEFGKAASYAQTTVKLMKSQESNNSIPYSGRHSRAMILLALARRQQILDLRITHYIAVIECLLARQSDTEIRYRIAERSSLLIGRSSEAKKKIFDDISLAYKIRSGFIHGQKLQISNAELTHISNNCDNIVRQLLMIEGDHMVHPDLTNDHLSAKQFDSIFLDIVLGR